jgi:hypothetical protein
MIYKNGYYKNNDLKVGDIIEDILMPEQLSLRGSVGWGPKWYFRLWQIEVININKNLCRDRVEFGQSKITTLQPDDPRVIEFLNEKFTVTDRELEMFDS